MNEKVDGQPHGEGPMEGASEQAPHGEGPMEAVPGQAPEGETPTGAQPEQALASEAPLAVQPEQSATGEDISEPEVQAEPAPAVDFVPTSEEPPVVEPEPAAEPAPEPAVPLLESLDEPLPRLAEGQQPLPPTPTEPLAIHHIGIAVRSITEAMRFYGDKLGLDIVDRRELTDRQLRIAFVQTGNTLIELMEATDPNGTVARFIERRGPGLHHLCFGTTDIEKHLRDLESKGAELIDQHARPGAHGLVAFLQPDTAHGVLVELLQPGAEEQIEAPY